MSMHFSTKIVWISGVSSDTGLYDYGERSHSRKSSQPNELKSPSEESGPPHHQQHHHHHHDPLNASPFTEVSAAEAAISSTENLLRNIQGLLKVAAENAKQQERRISLEKGTLSSHAVTQCGKCQMNLNNNGHILSAKLFIHLHHNTTLLEV